MTQTPEELAAELADTHRTMLAAIDGMIAYAKRAKRAEAALQLIAEQQPHSHKHCAIVSEMKVTAINALKAAETTPALDSGK